MKLQSTKTDTEMARPALDALTKLDAGSYERVLVALGRDAARLPEHVPSDAVSAYLVLWSDTSTLAADVQSELMRLTRGYMADSETRRDLAEMQRRLDEAAEVRRKEHAERFVASELDFGYTASGPLPMGDVLDCYALWCEVTGETELEDIIDRVPAWATIFRSFVPHAERELRDSRIREFFAESTDPNHYPIEDGAGLDDLLVAYVAWSGVDAPQNFRVLLAAIGKPPISTANGYRVHVRLKPRDQWEKTEPFLGYCIAKPDPYSVCQRTPGAVYLRDLGQWVLPEQYFSAVEREAQEKFATLRELTQVEDKSRADAQRAFDEAHPPQQATDQTQSQIFRSSYSQQL